MTGFYPESPDSKQPGQHSPQPGKHLGRGMYFLAWFSVLGLLTLFFGRWEEQQINPNTDPLSRVDSQVREVVLEGNQRHHYVANGRINGKTVTFLLDTGATDVVVPEPLAQKLGLRRGNRSYAHTANGTVIVYSTRIDRLDLGVIHLRDVRASINPAMEGQAILLGMSALGQIEFTQRGNQLTLRQVAP